MRPPRKDRKVGTLATRAPHRPNPIGLSALKLLRVDADARKVSGDKTRMTKWRPDNIADIAAAIVLDRGSGVGSGCGLERCGLKYLTELSGWYNRTVYSPCALMSNK